MNDENNRIVELIQHHYRNRTAKTIGNFCIAGMAEFARGVVCVKSHEVKEQRIEYDTYFSEGLWEFRHPQIWDGTIAFPPTLKKHNIGMLPGAGRAPQPQDYRAAMAFAKIHLQRIPLPWYKRFVEL